LSLTELKRRPNLLLLALVLLYTNYKLFK
jgi:hypothetical protein